MADETTKNEEAAQAEAEAVEVPAKFKDLVETIESMSVLDLSELVKILEKKFGVSAQAVQAAAPAAAAGAEAEPEKDSFDVELTSVGDQKVPVIKAVKEILGLGLKEAKDMVDGAPVAVKAGAGKDEAQEIKKKIEDAGGTVTLK